MAANLPPITHNIGLQRFECMVERQLCLADYQMSNGVILLTRTRVPEALEGRGIASALVRSVLDYARSEGLKVDPLCSFASAYLQRHPETQDVLARSA